MFEPSTDSKLVKTEEAQESSGFAEIFLLRASCKPVE